MNQLLSIWRILRLLLKISFSLCVIISEYLLRYLLVIALLNLTGLIGGSSTSQHCKGEAIDIDCDIFGGLSNREVFEYIKEHLTFDQLIWEFGDDSDPDWVHVSYKKGKNRGEVLRAKRNKRNTYYEFY